jgi:formate hydrogenlyase transcriptional activator
MSTIDEARPLTGNLQQRLDFETLISELSSRFIDLRPGELDREMEDGLRRICEPLGIDLAILWQWSQAVPDVIVPTHVYHVDGVARPSEPMQQDQYPWARQQMLEGRLVVISPLQAYPAQAAIDRETCRLYGINSGVCIPLSVGCEPPIGALGLNFLREERDWPDALVKRLQLVAQVFTHALARQRHEQRLLQSERRLAAGAELAGLAYYEVNFEEGSPITMSVSVSSAASPQAVK